jgi:hypothetical protein
MSTRLGEVVAKFQTLLQMNISLIDYLNASLVRLQASSKIGRVAFCLLFCFLTSIKLQIRSAQSRSRLPPRLRSNLSHTQNLSLPNATYNYTIEWIIAKRELVGRKKKCDRRRRIGTGVKYMRHHENCPYKSVWSLYSEKLNLRSSKTTLPSHIPSPHTAKLRIWTRGSGFE